MVYNFWLTEKSVAESWSFDVLMSEVSSVPRHVVAWADRFWVSS